MNLAISVDQKQLMNVLLNVGTVRPVFIWGAPGIGKSAIVEQFAADVGLPCISLLGSQLALKKGARFIRPMLGVVLTLLLVKVGMDMLL